MKRWHVVINYKVDVSEVFDLEELAELQDIVETGPDWNTIEDIKITYNYNSPPESEPNSH